MSGMSPARTTAPEGPAGAAARPARRLVGIDAARGLALIGLISVHILPDHDAATDEPTWSHLIFSGDSAALFALLAGVGLALTSGGRRPHGGATMTADRIGLAVRAGLIALVGLLIGVLMPEDAPADNILIYYGMFFLLAVPFLHAGPRVLFGCAAVFWLAGPLLMQGLTEVLPEWSSSNPTFADVVSEPAGTLSQLLLTGTYPALPYMTYLLAGMGLGRLDLRRRGVQVRLLAVGLGLTVLARVASFVLLHVLGGSQRLLEASSLDEQELAEALIWGPDSPLTESMWWLAIDTPHTNTPPAIAASLGVGLAVLGALLLIARRFEAWLLPLAAMGAMTLTLYTAHLVALSFEVHEDRPALWYAVHLVVAAVFAVAWQRAKGQGPLEKVIGRTVKGTRRLALRGTPRPPDRQAPPPSSGGISR
ncbi:heparan-alpha-glucosaminide N-acetyltransferase domain-containing protein [Kocuria sp. CPCC 205268]|uniref:heparan-alpha-glucosaminide N-acetyltransferase domain-containing protein n=1 Tax=Kocuria oxytropis TaxID=3058913 RepID=UPI0034D40805